MHTTTPALDQLQELMLSHRIQADPVNVAGIVLEIFRERYPLDDEVGLRKWVEQLAVDALYARSKGRQS
jgi:hypothetical protein